MNPKRRKQSVRPRLEILEDRLVLTGNVAWYDGVSQYQYNIVNVPDVDQRRGDGPFTTALPGDGAMYCAPTAAMNWMAYIANHGYPQIGPGPGDWQLSGPLHPEYNNMTNALASLGAKMYTDPATGTGDHDAKVGMQQWLGTTISIGDISALTPTTRTTESRSSMRAPAACASR
jgi:hypothetical protein